MQLEKLLCAILNVKLTTIVRKVAYTFLQGKTGIGKTQVNKVS